MSPLGKGTIGPLLGHKALWCRVLLVLAKLLGYFHVQLHKMIGSEKPMKVQWPLVSLNPIHSFLIVLIVC